MKKKLFFSGLLLSFLGLTQAQVINIPDANFKQALVNGNNVDTNGDGEIDVSEAEAITYLNVANSNITSLEGIDYFKNLESFGFTGNNVSTLSDLSNLTALVTLDCSWNPLTSLDVSKLPSLIMLECNYTQITSLDVSTNTQLNHLWAYSNPQLTFIDMNNGTEWSKDGAIDQILLTCNPLLTKICTTPGTETNVYNSIDMNKPEECKDIATPTVVSNCSQVLGTNTTTINGKVTFYPNPASNVIYFSTDVSKVEIYNLNGQSIRTTKPNGKSMDVSSLKKGVYLLKAQTKDGSVTQKLIKE